MISPGSDESYMFLDVAAMIRKLFAGLRYSLAGLAHAYRRDASFRMEVWSAPAFLIFGYLVSPLSASEFLFLALSFALIIIAELINTAFERALERLHPERHELIGATKDIASAAVLIAICFAFLVVSVISWNRFS